MMMFLILILNSLNTFAHGSPVKFSGRIFNGIETNISSHPYMVSVQYEGQHWCGGALVNESVVLTTRSCLGEKLVNGLLTWLTVRVGSNIWRNGTEYWVDRIHTFDGYDKHTMSNDIVALILEKPVEINPNVRIIPLATRSPKEGDIGNICGWGQTNSGFFELSDQLRDVDLKLYPRNQCGDTPRQTVRPMPEGTFCAETDGKDACEGDFGGPMVYNGTLIGLLSDNYLCDIDYFASVYTDISAFRDRLYFNRLVVPPKSLYDYYDA